MLEKSDSNIKETTDELYSYYGYIRNNLIDYLVNGKLHSTIVGMVIVLDGDNSKNDEKEAKKFADYFVDLLKKVDFKYTKESLDGQQAH